MRTGTKKGEKLSLVVTVTRLLNQFIIYFFFYFFSAAAGAAAAGIASPATEN